MARRAFPAGFAWGAATSSYQIEGSPLEDGACPSIWHVFAHKSGKISDGANGDVACDHYHRYPEDIRAMKDMGLKAYRFSIAWPRIFSEPDRINQKGLAFYHRLVDELLSAGIEPFATLFHWDEPVWLEDMGGLAWRGSVDHLVRYGETLFRALGDRVKKWITINEPVVYAFYGYGTGFYAPGRARDLRGLFHCTHHMLLGHARLADACAALVPGGSAGLANHCDWISPREPSTRRDVDTARFMMDAEVGLYNDPIFLGEYPRSVLARLGKFFPRGFEKDLSEIKKPQGFLGINYYSRNRYRHAPLMPYLHAKEVVDPSAPRSAAWEIYPEGLRELLLLLRDRYGNPPCYITENGYPAREEPGRDPLDDPDRIAYIADHATMVHRAIEDGVDCRGYFYWSLMDNFEWSNGTQLRFGLLRTDFESQKRQWRKSASWFKDMVARNTLES